MSSSRFPPAATAAATVAIAVIVYLSQTVPGIAQNTAASKPTDEQHWSIAAPGLVEPNEGEIGLGVEIVGRVVGIPVSLRDNVKAGQVLIRLDDSDALARIQSTQAEVEIRERNRDNVAATRRGRSRRRAADKLADAEVALFAARRGLDRLDEKVDGRKPTTVEIDAALKAIADAKANLATAQKELEDINALEETPLFSRSESALELARANHTLAMQAYEKTRVRVETDGTVLRINVKKGEVVSPQRPRPLVTVGDISRLRVRAEVDERSVADVKNGQKAIIRSVAFEGKDFNATISEISASLGPGRIGKRQLRGPSNANVLEVLLDIDGETPLLSGMEVDVLFEGEADKSVVPAQPAAAATN
ncbi:MAG: HlyD family secretion protein [Hyphomicrobiaceae bacterium]